MCSTYIGLIEDIWFWRRFRRLICETCSVLIGWAWHWKIHKINDYSNYNVTVEHRTGPDTGISQYPQAADVLSRIFSLQNIASSKLSQCDFTITAKAREKRSFSKSSNCSKALLIDLEPNWRRNRSTAMSLLTGVLVREGSRLDTLG